MGPITRRTDSHWTSVNSDDISREIRILTKFGNSGRIKKGKQNKCLHSAYTCIIYQIVVIIVSLRGKASLYLEIKNWRTSNKNKKYINKIKIYKLIIILTSSLGPMVLIFVNLDLFYSGFMSLVFSWVM